MDIDNMEENYTPNNEHIASYTWHSGHLSAAYYNTTTMEMFVTHEVVDLKPDFWHLKNLFRQIKVTNVLASGPNIFLKEIIQLLGMSDKCDPSHYRLNQLKTLSAAEFIVYTNNEKTLQMNRKRILDLNLPRMTAQFTEQDRYNFIETILPLHQTLIVQCLGNLLNYLDANWKHLFLRNDNRPIITDIHVYHLESQVLMDESTFNAMQIFAAKDHPSGFKMRAIGSTKEGLSFFNIMNTCVSRIGTNELKMWLQRPTRDIQELHKRYKTIDWCRNETNFIQMTKLKGFLKNIGNIGELYFKLCSTNGKPTIWKAFKQSIYYANCAGIVCGQSIEANLPGLEHTIPYEFGIYVKQNEIIESMLNHIDIIVDLEESLKLAKFCVKYGLDPDLDSKKDKILQVISMVTDKAAEEINSLPEFIHELTVHFVSEMGFLIGTAFPTMGLDTPPPAISNTSLNFLYKTKDSFYFNTPLCVEFNEKYGHLYVDVCEREQQICIRLLAHIHEHLADLQHIIRFCAKLDAIIALATFSMNYNLTKPEMVVDHKMLEITDGRHLLLDIQRKFVPNNTSIDVDKKKLINILIAPNASGKSVYMKQLAQIVYLAHIGSFVPARSAKLSVVDAIYTRIYSPESLFQAKSSFLIEIQQMGNVMTNSSSESLILVDELGQGTNAADGKALLLSCLEHLIERGEAAPITIITTHYNDVYDYMINKEWIVLKTFRVSRNPDGSFVSTFELHDGKCVENYAKDCMEVREFLNQAIASECDLTKDNSTDRKSASTIGYETKDNLTAIMEFSDELYSEKVKCAATILYNFIKRPPTSIEDTYLLDTFLNWELKVPTE